MLVATFVTVNPQMDVSPKKVVEGLFMLATAAFLFAATRRRHGPGIHLALYAGVAGLALPLMRVNRDPVHDVLVSGTVFALAAVYVLGRAQREQRWQQDIYHAEHDALTDALTRYGLRSWIQGLAPATAVTGLIVTCDLDDFKWFNDTFGHAIGDEVLKIFAQRLARELRPGDALVRLGGDEFELWLPGLTAPGAATVVERVHSVACGAPYELSVGPLRVGVSMGWCEGPLTAETARRSDQRLLQAKRLGKNRVVAPSDPDESSQSEGEGTAFGLHWLCDAMQALWTLSPTPALLTDLDGRIVAANPAYERLTGRGMEELTGQKPGLNSAGETAPEVYGDLWRTLRSGRPWHGAFKNRRPDGTDWWADEWIVPVQSGGRVVGYWSSILERQPGVEAAVPSAAMHAPTAKDDTFDIADCRLEVVFQPIVELATETVLGYEALVRPYRRGGLMAPQVFFERAAAAGMEVEADLACLEAIRCAVATVLQWPAATKLFVNVRNATLRERPMFPHEILMSLTGIIPFGQMVVEVSEQGIESLQDFEALMCHRPHLVFAQDDVGSGEADLARLVRLQPAWVKIDAALVSRVATEPQTRDLVAALTTWAHGTGARVIGEAVEGLEQARILKDCGVDAAQGYLWARPSANLAGVPRLLTAQTEPTTD